MKKGASVPLQRRSTLDKDEQSHLIASFPELPRHFESDIAAKAKSAQKVRSARLKTAELLQVMSRHGFDRCEGLLWRTDAIGRLIGPE